MSIKSLGLTFLVLFLFSCEGPSPDSNWRERADFVGQNGKTITGEQAEQAGLVVYSILKFLLKEESKDTLNVITKSFPWDALKEQKLNLDVLDRIKKGYTFSQRTTAFDKENKYPTFYYNLGRLSMEDKSLKGVNRLWQLKNHEYSFKNDKDEEVEISFFTDPKNIRIQTTSWSVGDQDGSTTEIEYYAQMQYKPKDKQAKISSGKVSFEVHAKTGYTKTEINSKSKGTIISLKDNKIKVRDFTKDIAVFEMLNTSKTGFRVISLAEDGKQYRIRPKKGIMDLYNGKSAKMNVSKVVWDYVESINYKLEKEPFLEWFAREILSKRSQYSKDELEAKYLVAFSIGDMKSMLLYSENVEKQMDFSMELK